MRVVMRQWRRGSLSISRSQLTAGASIVALILLWHALHGPARLLPIVFAVAVLAAATWLLSRGCVFATTAVLAVTLWVSANSWVNAAFGGGADARWDGELRAGAKSNSIDFASLPTKSVLRRAAFSAAMPTTPTAA